MMEEQTTLEGAHLHTSCVRRNCGAVLDFYSRITRRWRPGIRMRKLAAANRLQLNVPCTWFWSSRRVPKRGCPSAPRTMAAIKLPSGESTVDDPQEPCPGMVAPECLRYSLRGEYDVDQKSPKVSNRQGRRVPSILAEQIPLVGVIDTSWANAHFCGKHC